MILLRPLARLLGSVLMLVIALAGLGVAMYCFDGFISLGSARPDRLLGLPGVRRHVGTFLQQIGDPGPTAALALLGGLVAIALGLLVLAGVLTPPRRRLAVLEHDTTAGSLAVKPRTLRAMAHALAEQASGATSVKRPRLSLARSGRGGRLTVTASRARTSDPEQVQNTLREQLAPISDPFGLRTRARVRLGEAGERVQ